MKAKISDIWADNYKDYYDGPSRWREMGAVEKTDNIISLSSEVPHKKILEVGSGEGACLERLDKLHFGEELYSLEISESAIEAIQQRGLKALKECQIFDGYSIPYPDKFFDLVTLSHVLEHVEFPRVLLYEAKRVARHVFLEIPMEDTIRLPKHFFFTRKGHINFLRPKTFKILLQTCGLKITKFDIRNRAYKMYKQQYGIKGIWAYFVKELLLKISPRLATKLFTYHGIALCKSEETIKIQPLSLLM